MGAARSKSHEIREIAQTLGAYDLIAVLTKQGKSMQEVDKGRWSTRATQKGHALFSHKKVWLHSCAMPDDHNLIHTTNFQPCLHFCLNKIPSAFCPSTSSVIMAGWAINLSCVGKYRYAKCLSHSCQSMLFGQETRQIEGWAYRALYLHGLPSSLQECVHIIHVYLHKFMSLFEVELQTCKHKWRNFLLHSLDGIYSMN